MTRDVYVGRSGRALRVDIGLHTPARTGAALDEVAEIRRVAAQALSQSPLAKICGDLVVETTGESPIYADIRAVRERDMRVIACAAITAIFVILVVLIRSWLKASILIAATLLTYLAAYGITWLVFTTAFGVESLSYPINFLLFITILSLGQDLNIYFVSRIR